MYDPQRGFPGVVPEIGYRDTAAAVRWLTETLGFAELLRHPASSDNPGHVDMSTGHGIVMLARTTQPAPGRDRSTAATGGEPPPTVCLVFVDDVDAHARRAREAGASLLTEPSTRPWGLRQYEIDDPEGHRWQFNQHIADVLADDWGATVVGDRTLLG